ncbi:SMI1/KNR4 family protein [Streptomyces roseifaciens]|uniref:SMI1/KNR4 family protein n=1 Tax=Streptomyces roseifaciens TaxID=1488406 RepID=UPI00071818EA|nr:SMI1/KNR4 family protein [Streptomyces roseifaciens]
MTEAASDASFNWRPFLEQWSEEWADACGSDEEIPDGKALQERRLGFAPASAAHIAAAEERLGCRLPPSYRAFLEISDGWRNAGGFVRLLAGTAHARWYEDEAGFGEFFREELVEGSSPEEIAQAGMWSRALQLDVESDATYILMDPQDVTGNGEWAVYCHKVWTAAPPQRYESFRAYMEAMYREFHYLRAQAHEEREFVNATTRALDAVVEEAWHMALAGDYESAEAALVEPDAFGRPRAGVLLGQIRHVLDESSHFRGGPGMSAAVRAQEFPPAPARAASGHDAYDARAWLVGPLWRKKPSFSYAAPGPFGAAIEEAREQARWGDTDTAWRTIVAALPRWQPLGADHLVPFGLLEDSLLGPLMTPERRRELLAVPRGPEGVVGSGPVAEALDPGGLAWLADGEGDGRSGGYRFVLVEGVEPAELPGHIGADGEGVLHEPMTQWDVHDLLHSRGERSSYDDKPMVSVGRAGAGWSFAFDGEAHAFDKKRFVSPAAAAAAGTRAVVVWSSRAESCSPPAFHLSVAENGAEMYAFTACAAEVVRNGHIPPTLDPDLFFTRAGDSDAWLSGERRALEAIAAEFGVSLPRFALSSACRLHRFRTRSWTRPPGPGETYMVVSWGAGEVCWRQGVAGV